MTCTFTLTPTFTPYPAGEIRIYPNPVGIDSGKKLKFGNLFPGSSVCIYTLSGEFVTGINSQGGLAVWDMMNNWHSRVSPGIYYYVIKNPINNKIFTGKIFVTAH
jgi:hypothetical protein